MGKTTIVILACDRCGKTSLDGSDLHTVIVSLPGKLARAFSWDLCGPCVDDVGRAIREHTKSDAPVEVPL